VISLLKTKTGETPLMHAKYDQALFRLGLGRG